MITQSRVEQLLRYDPDTGYLYWRVKRRGRFARPGAIAGHVGRYVMICIDCEHYPAHHLVWLMHHGYVPDEIDHIDQDKHNNRLSNLRLCDRSANMGNVVKRCNNTSGYKGVWFAKHANKWRASIKVGYKAIHIGYFNEIVDAARAYNKSAVSHFGEFACLNEI